MPRTKSKTKKNNSIPTNSEGRPLEVHLNLNVRGMPQSATIAINDRCNAMRQSGRRVFKFGLGQSPFPVPRPVIEELQANAHQKDYLPVRGLPALREAVADYLRRTHGLPTTPEQVIVGPGSKELMFLLQLVYYGDIVIPTPAWVSYAPQAHIIGRQVEWIHTRASDGWRLTPEMLNDQCRRDRERPRILVLNYPSNPTGATYATDELEALADVAREHRIVVLSDEIYGELQHDGAHVSIARFYPEGTIVSTGLSKWCGAGGWRLGTFGFPASMEWLLDSMASVASETYTSTSAPIQYAAVRAFHGGMRLERYLWNSRRILSALAAHVVAKLESAGVNVVHPAGAFYVFPDFCPHREALAKRGIRTSGALCETILEETGVAMLPGSDFGRPAQELTLRLAYVDFDGGRALAAVETLPRDSAPGDDFIAAYCTNVLSGMDALVEWMNKNA
jgi:aspartate aminotransferase